MESLVFATNNVNKLAEIKQILSHSFQILSLQDIGFHQQIEEPFFTLHENALQKAKVIHNFCGLNVFSDDTGLEVNALGGEPGVFSARYAGENASYSDNVNKLLHNLNGVEDRLASFKTVIALIYNGVEHTFTGEVHGHITNTQFGTSGFGYDPIFKPLGFNQTFAEMDIAEKNRISHRSLALQKLKAFLLS